MTLHTELPPQEHGPEAESDPRVKGTDAAQWRLVWRRFRRHRLAMIGMVVMVVMYLVAIFAGFVAPFSKSSFNAEQALQPPQLPKFSTEHGLHVHPSVGKTNLETMNLEFVEDETVIIELGFFVKGDSYQLLGFIDADRHLFGPKEPGERWYPLGGDRSGADLLSRTIYGAQISLSIGLLGVAGSLVLGLLIGGISGYFGGWVDNLIQRVIEIIMSIPTLPLWLGLAAAIPPRWSSTFTYFMITMILSLIGWTTLARVIRGRLLQARGEDFVMAARLDGVSSAHIIGRHLLPSFASHIIATVSLAVPSMILAETALSFLGLGLRSPAVSWGVLLQDAQNVQTLYSAPWLLIPGIAVVLAVVAFNFVGDGLRDSADPYGRRD
ncbi:ABC transporter permease subunit [Auraticoccus sp. F435]|uniref:ABC transporter permease subunit n=1 Tax=Auraticoccus cholistanensis TaxID=2656650 RepID=A0A6A9USV2_9ACTN|nr:ABC transporter permease [Auraticoccus cholistanensis]MVA75708.1 ABC transporter permease subunit [Auraticoccus cholistanensis]